MTRWIAFVALVLAIFNAPRGDAQAPAVRPKFEVASIKPTTADQVGDANHLVSHEMEPLPGGRLRVTNMTLAMLIRVAYGLRDSQILSGPKWIQSESYDIEGKSEGKLGSMDRISLLIQSLLADRFNLAVHFEKKDGPVYTLTVAKGDPKMQPTKGSCTAFDPDNLPPPEQQSSTVFCDSLGGTPPSNPHQRLRATAVEVGGKMGLAARLAEVVNRNVIDETGLAGRFDFQLNWTSDQAADGSPVSGGPAAPVSAGDTGSSIFTALQDQLGLRLSPGRGPVEVLVIDRVDRPSEN